MVFSGHDNLTSTCLSISLPTSRRIWTWWWPTRAMSTRFSCAKASSGQTMITSAVKRRTPGKASGPSSKSAPRASRGVKLRGVSEDVFDRRSSLGGGRSKSVGCSMTVQKTKAGHRAAALPAGATGLRTLGAEHTAGPRLTTSDTPKSAPTSRRL